MVLYNTCLVPEIIFNGLRIRSGHRRGTIDVFQFSTKNKTDFATSFSLTSKNILDLDGEKSMGNCNKIVRTLFKLSHSHGIREDEQGSTREHGDHGATELKRYKNAF